MDIQRITEKTIGAAFKVANTLGNGFLESIYENSMKIEFQKQGLIAENQKPIKVYYESQCVGDFVADFLVENVLIVELKAASALSTAHEVQLVNSLKATGIDHGLLINFGTPKVQVRHKFRNVSLPDHPPAKP